MEWEDRRGGGGGGGGGGQAGMELATRLGEEMKQGRVVKRSVIGVAKCLFLGRRVNIYL